MKKNMLWIALVALAACTGPEKAGKDYAYQIEQVYYYDGQAADRQGWITVQAGRHAEYMNQPGKQLKDFDGVEQYATYIDTNDDGDLDYVTSSVAQADGSVVSYHDENRDGIADRVHLNDDWNLLLREENDSFEAIYERDDQHRLLHYRLTTQGQVQEATFTYGGQSQDWTGFISTRDGVVENSERRELNEEGFWVTHFQALLDQPEVEIARRTVNEFGFTLEQVESGSGLDEVSTYTYDELGFQLTGSVTYDGTLLNSESFTRDPNGEWTAHSSDDDGDGTDDFSQTRTYTLDEYDRLQTVERRSVDGDLLFTYTRTDLGFADEVDLDPFPVDRGDFAL